MYRRRLASQNTLDSSRLKKSLIKRPKLAETLQNETSSYLKFLVMWLIVIALDLALDFRLEFLWPCWMFLKRIFESFKYKNCMQAFVLMGCTFCSDYFIYAFIPSSWIFFVASTYVWTQQLFSPDRGVGFPVLVLWTLFVYMESCVRVNQPDDQWSKALGSNCIGYPIVMLGFGFKSCMSLHWAEKCRQLISYKNDFFYRLISTHAESQNLYHAPVRAFKRTNLLKLRYKMRYSGSTFQNVEEGVSEESLRQSRVNGLLISMNDSSPNYVEVLSGSCIDEVSPLTGRSWNFSSMRTFLGHTVDPNEDFWTFDAEESDSSLSTTNTVEMPQPVIKPKTEQPITTTTNNTGHKRSNNILSKMFDFREKPSAKVSPVDKVPEPVKEARVTPIKKVEEAPPLKQPTKSDRRSKKQTKKQDNSNNDDHGHTAVKIHLDKLKDIDDDLYFILQNHLDTCQNTLREEKLARLRAELIYETMEENLKKTQQDLQSSKNGEKHKEEKVQNLMSINKTLQSENDKQRYELHKKSNEKKIENKPTETKDRGLTCDLLAKEPDHSKCQQVIRSNESIISDLKREIEGNNRSLINEQNINKSLQKQESENLARTQRENEEIKKQNNLLTSKLESVLRNLRAECKVKMELFSALGDANRKSEELTHKLEQRNKENDMLKQRVAEAMAVSSFPTSSFGVPTTATDTFYSAKGF